MGKAMATQEPMVGLIEFGMPEAQHSRVRGGAARVPVTSIMTREVLHVRPELSLDSLAELFVRTGLSRVPVVDARGKVVGMVSKTDLVAERQQRGDTEEGLAAVIPLHGGGAFEEPGLHVHEAEATAADVMTREVVSLPDTATVADAAALMATLQLHGLPVVSPAQRLLGLVSSLDVITWVAGLG
jgi:CBS domain-containing protein